MRRLNRQRKENTDCVCPIGDSLKCNMIVFVQRPENSKSFVLWKKDYPTPPPNAQSLCFVEWYPEEHLYKGNIIMRKRGCCGIQDASEVVRWGVNDFIDAQLSCRQVDISWPNESTRAYLVVYLKLNYHVTTSSHPTKGIVLWSRHRRWWPEQRTNGYLGARREVRILLLVAESV